MKGGERRCITHGTGGFGVKSTSSMVRASSERSLVQYCRGFSPGIFWGSPVNEIWFPASCWNRLPADTDAASNDTRGRVESFMIFSSRLPKNSIGGLEKKDWWWCGSGTAVVVVEVEEEGR